MTGVKMNCWCFIAILETIQQYVKQLTSGQFKNLIYKTLRLETIYNVYKEDLALNNLELIWNKNKPNQI